MESGNEDDESDLPNNALILDDSDMRKKNRLNLINTNARSLCPKIDSLLDCFEELEVDLAVVTET